MSEQILHTIILAFCFLALFALAEFFYHSLKIKVSLTRQTVHFGAGLLTLLFPVLLVSRWQVFILCASFALILFVSKKFNFLKSIHSIDRFSYGSILYPIAVYCCFCMYCYFNKNLIFFYLPILILAICDPLAALVGTRLPYGRFNIGNDKKTASGSVSFFLSAIIISIVSFWLFSAKNIIEILPVILLIAVISTIVEAISVMGFDNITIPASVLLVLTLFG